MACLLNGLAMIAADRSFLNYVDRVLLARDITPEYAAKVRYCCRKFCEWLGFDLGIDALDCDPVNEFLAQLKVSGKRPDTVAGYRRAILVVWHEAYQCRDNNNAPLRVRKIRTARDPVEAMRHSDIRTVLTYVNGFRDYLPNGARRCDFWCGAIHSAYATGLRRGDLLKVRRDQIRQGGIAHVRQNKTGYPVAVRFSCEAMEAIDRMRVSDLALPWPYHENALSRQFRRIAKAAGVRGQFRWLRRSAASYAERECRGDGKRILGHRTDRVFQDFYDDPTISGQHPAAPPPLCVDIAVD